MLPFYTKFVVQRCIVCCDRRHLDKSTSDYIRNTGTQGSCKRICVLKSHLRFEIASAFWKSHLRFEIASAFWNRICVLKSHMRFEIAYAFWKSHLRFQIASAFWNRICVLKSHLRFEIASAFWNRICVLKSHLRFEIASAIATQLRFQNVTSPQIGRQVERCQKVVSCWYVTNHM